MSFSNISHKYFLRLLSKKYSWLIIKKIFVKDNHYLKEKSKLIFLNVFLSYRFRNFNCRKGKYSLVEFLSSTKLQYKIYLHYMLFNLFQSCKQLIKNSLILPEILRRYCRHLFYQSNAIIFIPIFLCIIFTDWKSFSRIRLNIN